MKADEKSMKPVCCLRNLKRQKTTENGLYTEEKITIHYRVWHTRE